ncbi:hypothetical protein [Halorubrum sp. GN11GM_10-3_MGM]|uniref:hypothetical protein n=1 Tax=Halorubrum sp. GN11GM_10-3_MGM TaxID=2518111 RepID=UPI0010F60CB4|nr:hypothetical protein [Halorubrum sp. GN11GM_10-3_MGM]TKX70946.1 hypothetical protein EXE40_08600 [Halorubrum sp. GN11GM_10-3_MGM]
MTERVYPFLNLTLPENEYSNQEHGVRIELLEEAKKFENHHRDRSSKYSEGYYHTANVYIDQPEEEAQQTADALSQILSFALWRDVIFNGKFPDSSADSTLLHINTAKFDIDNTHMPIIEGVATGLPDPGLELGPFLDLALEETVPASESEQKKKLRPIWFFLEASASVSAGIEFLLLWVALESCANENYESYKENVGDLFSETEREEIQSIVLEVAEERFSQDQVDFLENRFGQDHLYEYGIDLKIKIFLEYLNIGFDMEEIEEIIKESKRIRNLVVHQGESDGLFNKNVNRLSELRKILIFVIFRRLGVDRELQDRLVTPTFPGPNISESN